MLYHYFFNINLIKFIIKLLDLNIRHLIFTELWSEYLKLRKHCEDADFKIPFQLLESNIYDNKAV